MPPFLFHTLSAAMPDDTEATEETIVTFGSEVKALGDGKLGGYLVRFSGPQDPDLENDYFTPDTDFGSAEKADVRYNHGIDEQVGKRSIGTGHLKTDEVGVWIEAQLEMRDDYERAIYQLAQEGKLSWSSGTSPHLVEREEKGGAYHIKRWPLGPDASLTPTPAEPRNQAMPIKNIPHTTLNVTLEESGQEDAVKASTDTDSTGEPAADRQSAPASTEAHKSNRSPDTEDTMADEATPQEEQAAEPQISPLEEYKAGLITKNEYRKAVGKEPIEEGGDRFADEQPEQKAHGGKTVKKTHSNDFTTNVHANGRRPDNFAEAFKHWVRTGDTGGVKGLITGEATPQDVKAAGVSPGALGSQMVEIKASNDTDMNITTAADGGNAVPTGHFNGIIARRDESMLANRLGVRNIPGVGTTVNVPIDDEDDGEFVQTGEGSTNDRDAPAIGQVAMTLVKYTKRIELTDELMQDEASRLMEFLNDFVGRGMAKTHNDLLITEVETNGTSFKTFSGTSAIAQGEPEEIVGNDDLGEYLDDTSSVAWVTRNSTLWTIKSITGSDRQYDVDLRQGDGPQLLGYPVLTSQKVEALGSGNKPIHFGNWNFVGKREAPSFQVLRDPYSAANDGYLRLHYFFRTVYKVLQSEAIGYGENGTS